MSKQKEIIIRILCVFMFIMSVSALLLSLAAFNGTTSNNKVSVSTDYQYVIYLGTNDKDTNTPVFTPQEAKLQAQNILIEHFGGYTIQEASGGWIDDNKTVFQEYTLVIYLSDTSSDLVHKAADDLIRVFNQSSVLIQTNSTTTEYYSGT